MEMVNRTLEMYLSYFTNESPVGWIKWLPWVEYDYNTSAHLSMGNTPYEVVYGQECPTLLSYVQGMAKVEAVAQTLEERDKLIKEVRLKL